MPLDKFMTLPDSPVAPSREAFAIVPDDAADLPVLVKGIYVGAGGSVRLQTADSESAVTYENLPDSSYIAVRARRVFATGTTASALVGEA